LTGDQEIRSCFVVSGKGSCVNPTDPVTFAAIVVVFLLIAATATWLPARRASQLDPMEAIRDE